GGEPAQGVPGAAFDQRLPIDEDLEFAVATAHHLDIDSQLAPQPGRHTGGMQPRDSVGAITNGNPAHDDLPRQGLGSAPLGHGGRLHYAPGVIRSRGRTYWGRIDRGADRRAPYGG